MMLRAPATVPPIVLFDPATSTPADALPTAPVPAALVPIRLPCTATADARLSIRIPQLVLPEMTLPAPATVPPMVLLAPVTTSTPLVPLARAPLPLTVRPM